MPTRPPRVPGQPENRRYRACFWDGGAMNMWTEVVEVLYGGQAVRSPLSPPNNARERFLMKTTRLLLTACAAVVCAFSVTPARAGLSFVQSFGSRGSGSGQFNAPYRVAADSAGNVYVADHDNNHIDAFNVSNFSGTFTAYGGGTQVYGSGVFNGPQGVTVDSSGNVYVADVYNDRIDRFIPSDFVNTLRSYGSTGSGSGRFHSPTDVAVDSSGNVYVADFSNSRVDMFNPSNFAATFTTFGTAGSGIGQFNNPQGLTVDGAGNVYVADENNSRIVRFNTSDFTGTFTTFGSSGFGSGQFNFPFDVVVDPAGNVYVADQYNQRIVTFNPANFAGTFTTFGSGQGSGNGQFNNPTGLALDGLGNLFVSDSSNNRIVELSGVVPEPASAALLLTGGALLALRRRRS